MAIKTVNAAKLDAALTATANAIRTKTGGTAQISFDFSGQTGFKSAIEAITGGGGGDYDILATITGDIQTLAITDASGGGGVHHEHGTIAYHTGANTQAFSWTFDDLDYDNVIFVATVTKSWKKINDEWVEQETRDYSNTATASKQLAQAIFMQFPRKDIADFVNSSGTTVSVGYVSPVSMNCNIYSGTTQNRTVGIDDTALNGNTISGKMSINYYLCSDTAGQTFEYDVWGWNN